MYRLIKNLFSKNDAKIAAIVRNGAYLVDVRTPAEFAEGHVNRSVNIPLDQLSNRLEDFSRETPIVVFCRSGNRSALALAMLAHHGFTKVVNGGTWQQIDKIVNN